MNQARPYRSPFTDDSPVTWRYARAPTTPETTAATIISTKSVASGSQPGIETNTRPSGPWRRKSSPNPTSQARPHDP